MVYICLQTLQGIAYLHKNGVYFGDMKPENLLVFRNMAIKLGDFGISMKLPDGFKLEDTISNLKGFTNGYSNETFTHACDNGGEITIRDLILNEYYSLFKTFN